MNGSSASERSTARDLAVHLCQRPPVPAEVSDQLRQLVTGADREIVASLLLRELAARLGKDQPV